MAQTAPGNDPIPFPSQGRPPRLTTEGPGISADEIVPSGALRSRKVTMGDITREEMDAKLEAVEARLETRLVSMDAKLDNLLSEIRRVGETAMDAKHAASEAKTAASAIKWNVFFAALGGIGITASLVVAFWAIGWQIADIVRPN